MKTKLLTIIGIIAVLAINGCENQVSQDAGNSPDIGQEEPATEPQLFTVTFNSNGGSDISPISNVNYGDTIPKPEDPVKTGYDCIFEGWYNQNLTEAFSFTAGITADTTLYAKWRPYELGETGSGGGKIFYRDETGFPLYQDLENINFEFTPHFTVWHPTGENNPDMISIYYNEDINKTQFDYTFSNQKITCHYLEAAPSDLNVKQSSWWDYQKIGNTGLLIGIDVLDATEIGMGLRNTALIMFTSPNAPAAKACKEYSYGGKTDWFIPSKDELNMLNTNSAYVGNLENTSYWSSSGLIDQSGFGGQAWALILIQGKLIFFLEMPTVYYSIRPIRAF